MRSNRDRLAEAFGGRTPGRWEGCLVLGRDSRSAAVTLVDRETRFCVIPEGHADGLSTVVIKQIPGLPDWCARR
ncbi:hypothetical protein GCM10027160_24320 [Streptomyces calidiresistens]